MVALTLSMSTALALQFGGWLWVVNPRLLVIVIAIAFLFLGIYLSLKESIQRWRKYYWLTRQKQTMKTSKLKVPR